MNAISVVILLITLVGSIFVSWPLPRLAKRTLDVVPSAFRLHQTRYVFSGLVAATNLCLAYRLLSSPPSIATVFVFVSLALVFTLLHYIALVAFKHKTLPYWPAFILFVILVTINLANLFGWLIARVQLPTELWTGYLYTPLGSSFSALLAVAIMALLALLARGRTIGTNEIAIVAIVGLLLSPELLTSWAAFTLILLVLLGAFKAVIKGQKRISFPLIPAIIYAGILTILVGNSLRF